MDLAFKLDRQSKTPLYLQIANQIIGQIKAGSLKEEAALPAERKLAAILGINRSTVINAYNQLEGLGYVYSHVGRGTLVAPLDSREKKDSFGWQELLSGQGETVINAYNSTMAELLVRRDLINMDSGVAAPELYPSERFAELLTEIMLTEGQGVLEYNCAQGLKSFRESLADLMRLRSIHASTDNITILNGSQEGIDLVGRILLEPGDCVIVEQPTFLGAIDIFRAYGVRLIGVLVDDEGMLVSRLESILSRVKPKLIYTIPSYQNPTGTCMSLERRQRLLKLAGKYHVPILEDDAYGYLSYGSSTVPTLKSMDNTGIVIYLSTMSKILCPGLRLGWMVTPVGLTQYVVAGKQLTNLHSNNVTQRLVDLFYRKGYLQDQVLKSRDCYRNKLNLMLKALKQYAPEGMSWCEPEGGFYIWVSLPENLSAIQVLQEAINNNVAIVAGPVFFHCNEGHNHIRLNFSYIKPEQIDEGIRILCRVIKTSMKPGAKLSLAAEIKPIV
ncbi:MAG TPA: PLP-dependent aminotransferase family protein [Bacillota bacterium]|nr:PLP-dependent aminotransferase family protein [Bacillota bacterium]